MKYNFEREEPIEEMNHAQIIMLLDLMYKKYGYDFRDYSAAHLKRRIKNRMSLSGISTFKIFHEKIQADPGFAALCIKDFSIKVTEMFRDPSFYVALREKVIPLLKTYSFIKVWHAGSATGEEVYSMAILLQEEGLYDRSLIYATDFDQDGIEQGKEGIYVNERVQEYSKNYQKSGGKASLSDYYTSHYNRIIFRKDLKKNIVWANHNLVTDSVFAEVNLILCRNVLIYFNKNLQSKVHTLFLDSLANGGVLCLGKKENLQYSPVYEKFSSLDKYQKIYRKKYQPLIS
jgi:chemotaxis protein methyltransferase CheR